MMSPDDLPRIYRAHADALDAGARELRGTPVWGIYGVLLASWAVWWRSAAERMEKADE